MNINTENITLVFDKGNNSEDKIDNLSGIRIALVKDAKSDKSDIVLEEMNSTQGSLFSFLNLGKFIQG